MFDYVMEMLIFLTEERHLTYLSQESTEWRGLQYMQAGMYKLEYDSEHDILHSLHMILDTDLYTCWWCKLLLGHTQCSQCTLGGNLAVIQ